MHRGGAAILTALLAVTLYSQTDAPVFITTVKVQMKGLKSTRATLFTGQKRCDFGRSTKRS